MKRAFFNLSACDFFPKIWNPLGSCSRILSASNVRSILQRRIYVQFVFFSTDREGELSLDECYGWTGVI